MPRRNNDPASSGDNAKVRVFFAEVEGNNESVQEALKTMVSAMNRPVRGTLTQQANGKATPLLQTTAPEDIGRTDDELDEEQVAGEESGTAPVRRPRGSGKNRDRNAGVTLVPNLDFRPAGNATLKKFVEEKSPKNDLEAALVTVYYMQHMMGLPKIGPDHVMTAFKEIGRPIPGDLKQTIRNIKSSRMWINFTDIEDVRTTTQGDNAVEHDLGKSD